MKRLYDLHARLIEETKKLIDDGTPGRSTQSHDQYLTADQKSQQMNMQDQEQTKLSQPRYSQQLIQEQTTLKQSKDMTISKKHLDPKQTHLNLQSTLMDIQKEYLDYELQKTQQEFAVADRNNQTEDELSNTFEVEQILSNAKGHQLEQEQPGARKKKSEFIGLLKKCQICSDSDLNYASKPFKLSKKLRDVRIMLERKSNNIEQQLKRSNMNKNRIIEDIKADRVIIRKTLPQQAKLYLREIDQKQREVLQIPKSIFQPKNTSASTINASSNDISRTPFSIPALSTQTRRRSNVLNNQSQPQQAQESSLFFAQQQQQQQQYSIPNMYHQDSLLRSKRNDQHHSRLSKQRPSQDAVDCKQYGLDNLNYSSASNNFNNNNNNNNSALGLTSPSINQSSNSSSALQNNLSNNLSFIPLPAYAFQDNTIGSISSSTQSSAVQKRHIQKRFSSMLSHNYNLNQNTSEMSTPAATVLQQQQLQHKNSKSDYQLINFSGAFANNNNNSQQQQQPGNISIEKLQYLLYLKEQKNKEIYQSSSLTPMNSNLNKNSSPKNNNNNSNTAFIYSMKSSSSPMAKYQNQSNSFGLQQSLLKSAKQQTYSEALTPQTATTSSTNRNCTKNSNNTNVTIKNMTRSVQRNQSVSPSKNHNNNNSTTFGSNSFFNNNPNGITRNESQSPNYQPQNISQFKKSLLPKTSYDDGLSKRRAAARVFNSPSKKQAPKQDILANVYNFEEDAYFKHQQIYKYEQENAKILSIKRNATTKQKGKILPATTKSSKKNKLLRDDPEGEKEYLHDAFSSDDDEAPSATEALLENCYEESIKLQKKVLEADKGDLASKVKHLLKIESVNNEIKQLMSWIIKK